jgi:predicted permease
MSLLIEINTIVLPVFLVIGLGFGMKRTGLVDRDFLFQLNRLIYYLALPTMLFYKIATADFTVSFNSSQVLAVILATAAGFVVSYGHGTLRAYTPEVRGAFAQAACRGNLAYIGLAIILNAYGEEGLASGGVLMGFIVPVFNIFSILALLLPHRHRGGKAALGLMVRQIIGNPLIIACVAGTLWSFGHLGVPEVAGRALEIVAGMALPLALISIGASFSLDQIRGDLAKALEAVCLKLIGMPLLAALFLYLLGVHGRDFSIGIILAGTPTATAASILAQQLHGDAELSGSIIMLSTLLSIFTYTIALMVLKTMAI